MRRPDSGTGVRSLVADPIVITAIEFCRRLGLRVAESTIRAAFGARPATAKLCLADLIETFRELGIPLAAFGPPRGEVRNLPLPLIAVLLEEEGQIPVTLLDWGEDRVRLAHPFTGETWMAYKDFAACWNGIILAVTSKDAFAEPDFELRDAAGRAEREQYRQSIRVIDDWASPDECRILIDQCESRALFGRSSVQRQGSSAHRFISGIRTSESAHLDDRTTPAAAVLLARTAALLGVEVSEIEDLQCVRYLPGQMFSAHVDGAHRTFTLLVYLNDDFEGGETVFPDLGTAVEPRLGRALLFRNVDPSGAEIPWSRHMGTAPSAGTKYACNIWVRCRPDHVSPAPIAPGARAPGQR